MLDADFSELARLGADMGQVPARTVPFVRKAIEVTAGNVKDDARALAAAQVGRHGGRYPSAMEYVMKGGKHHIEAEIGPRPGGGKGNQGDLAPIFETGNPFSGRKASLEPALKHNTDDFLTGLSKALDDGLAL